MFSWCYISALLLHVFQSFWKKKKKKKEHSAVIRTNTVNTVSLLSLRWTATFGRFSVIINKVDEFLTSCLLFCTPIPLWKEIWKEVNSKRTAGAKRVYSKRKEFAPKGEQFFSFKSRTLFRRETKQFWKRCLPTWTCISSVPLKIAVAFLNQSTLVT